MIYKTATEFKNLLTKATKTRTFNLQIQNLVRSSQLDQLASMPLTRLNRLNPSTQNFFEVTRNTNSLRDKNTNAWLGNSQVFQLNRLIDS